MLVVSDASPVALMFEFLIFKLIPRFTGFQEWATVHLFKRLVKLEDLLIVLCYWI